MVKALEATETDKGSQSPLNGHWTAVSVVLAVAIGLASLLFFLTPAEIEGSFVHVNVRSMALSLGFFLLGCMLAAERWRACLNFRGGRAASFHSMGVALAGNLLIPGRLGEPLRVFVLARLGVGPEYGTSALVQERLGDQMMRVVFVAMAVLLTGVTSGSKLGPRLWAVSAVTAAAFAAASLVINRRVPLSSKLGRWLGRLPKLEAETASGYVLRTLDDLAESWSHSGSRKAILWGFLTWAAFTVHTVFILECFFDTNVLAMALMVMAVAPVTAPTHPGLYHGLCLAALMMVGAARVPGLQAAVVLHMVQMVVLTLWGTVSWNVLQAGVPDGSGPTASPAAK